MNIVDYADLYAERAHKGQVRKYVGEPYIEHPRRVANKLRHLNQTYQGINALVQGETWFEDEVIAQALLHDVIEDCGVTYQRLLDDFTGFIAKGVQNVTNTATKEFYPHLNRAERKRMELCRLSRIPGFSQSLKLADRIDNLPSVQEHDPDFYPVYKAESVALLAAMSHADPRLRKELGDLLA